MTRVLSFLLSWLSGMFSILITAFFSYDQFSLIDITSFAVFTFAGFLFLFLLIYLPIITFFLAKISIRRQFFFLPLLFSLGANLPAYILIWKNSGDLFGSSEALLFFLGFTISGVVFGLSLAWKNKIVNPK